MVALVLTQECFPETGFFQTPLPPEERKRKPGIHLALLLPAESCWAYYSVRFKCKLPTGLSPIATKAAPFRHRGKYLTKAGEGAVWLTSIVSLC